MSVNKTDSHVVPIPIPIPPPPAHMTGGRPVPHSPPPPTKPHEHEHDTVPLDRAAEEGALFPTLLPNLSGPSKRSKQLMNQ